MAESSAGDSFVGISDIGGEGKVLGDGGRKDGSQKRDPELLSNRFISAILQSENFGKVGVVKLNSCSIAKTG